MSGISEGEVAVYDRQLRLWGVAAQQRLLKAKVLVWGIEGSNVEVCKNLVLAGVSLAISDHRAVTRADVDFNYFLREEDLGKNRAECAARRIQEMNPLSAVTAITEAKADAASAIEGYDVVIAALSVFGWDVARACAVDAACRKVSASFLLTIACGELAFFFSDLGGGEHVVQEYTAASSGPADASAEAKPPEPQTLRFASLQQWLDGITGILQAGKCDGSVAFVALFAAFLRESPSKTPETSAAAFDAFVKGKGSGAPTVEGVPNLQDAYDLFFMEPLMHVASVIGGLLAQEVIKAITKRDVPLLNSVCFNAHTGAALVEQIPMPDASASKKRKVEETFDLDD